MTEKQPSPLRHRWRDQVKSPDGPDDPMLRLVLLVLGDWSPVEGGSFTVKNSTLSQQTGLGDRSLRDRLKQAEGVWFVRERRSRGRPYRYRLKIPTAVDAARPLEDVRNRSNGPWRDDVDNSGGCGTTAPDLDDEGAAPPRRTSGTTAPDQCGTTAPAIDVPIHKQDVARAGARSVENPDLHALKDEAPEPGAAARQAGTGPAESVAGDRTSPAEPAPVDDGDQQLPLARLVLQAVQGGDHAAFEEACAKIREQRRLSAAGSSG